MICPKCKAEYVRGVTVCADCNVPLVERLPEEKTDEKEKDSVKETVEYVEIWITFSGAEIAMIKSLLDSAGIDYHLYGERFATVRPLVYPARLLVRADQRDDALAILNDLDFGTWGRVNDTNE